MGHLRMRNPQSRRFDNTVLIQKDVQVDDPRRPVALSCPTQIALYRFEEIEEGFRLEIGLDLEDAVDKVCLAGLTRFADRLSLIKRRNTSDVSPCVVKTAARSLDVLMTVSLVRTDSDVNNVGAIHESPLQFQFLQTIDGLFNPLLIPRECEPHVTLTTLAETDARGDDDTDLFQGLHG